MIESVALAVIAIALGFLAGYSWRMRRERKRLTAGQIVARRGKRTFKPSKTI